MEAHQNLSAPTQGSYPENLEALTVWGLLNESARVIQKHVRLFLPFILIFTLPLSIYFAISLGSNFPDVHALFPDIHGFGHARSLMHTSVKTTAQQMQLGITDVNPLIILGVAIAKPIILTLFAWLQMASIAYCVDFIYKGKDNPESTPVQEIFKRLPGAVFRIFVTTLWLFCILIPIDVVWVLVTSLLFASTHQKYIMVVSYILLVGIGFILSLLFMFSTTLSTVEPGCYGRPALKQSFILVTKNQLRALGVFLFYLLLTIIVYALGFFVSKHDPLSWTKPLGFICLALVYLLMVVYTLVLNVIFYFSCKQLENATTNNYTAVGVNVP